MGEYSATADHAVSAQIKRPRARRADPLQQRTFPGRPDQAGEARRFLAKVLAQCPAGCPASEAGGSCQATDDAVLCLSELAANAAIHSYSARPGGHFTVRVGIGDAGRLRVEVTDEGGQWNWRDPHDLHGRGLEILRTLADDWGRSGDGDSGWTVWFELEC